MIILQVEWLSSFHQVHDMCTSAPSFNTFIWYSEPIHCGQFTDDVLATAGGLSLPQQITFDKSGNLYIAGFSKRFNSFCVYQSSRE